MGCKGNHHLNYLVESIFVNVGSPWPDEKVSSPPTRATGGGGFVVLSAWESHVHREGSPEAGVAVWSTEVTGDSPGEVWGAPQGQAREREDRRTNLGVIPEAAGQPLESPLQGQLARRVRRGA